MDTDRGFCFCINDMKFILGKKLHMTRIFSEDGQAIPVTAIVAGPCTVTAVMTEAKDNYQAIQVGFDHKRKLSKALAGHLKNLAGISPPLKRQFFIACVFGFV